MNLTPAVANTFPEMHFERATGYTTDANVGA